MINLNSVEYSEKEFLTKENVLKYIDEYSIFRYYIGDFQVNGIMKSPFRKDNDPSFGIFYSQMYNCLLFNDLARDVSGDCFVLVYTFVHPTFTYPEALAQVVIDFNISDRFILPRKGFSTTKKEYGEKVLDPIVPKMKFDLRIKARRYTTADYRYWNQFGISRPTLKKYSVVPISHFMYGRKVFKADKLAFAYIERKDKETTYKVYQPYSKKIKFFTNMNSTIHAGYTQLPRTGEYLIITKSQKDMMSIVENTGVAAIGVLSETVMIKLSVIEEYKKRFSQVVVFFDKDPTGIQMSKRYQSEYLIPAIEIPDEFVDCTDFSDIIEKYDIKRAKEFLDSELFASIFKFTIDDLPF